MVEGVGESLWSAEDGPGVVGLTFCRRLVARSVLPILDLMRGQGTHGCSCKRHAAMRRSTCARCGGATLEMTALQLQCWCRGGEVPDQTDST